MSTWPRDACEEDHECCCHCHCYMARLRIQTRPRKEMAFAKHGSLPHIKEILAPTIIPRTLFVSLPGEPRNYKPYFQFRIRICSDGKPRQIDGANDTRTDAQHSLAFLVRSPAFSPRLGLQLPHNLRTKFNLAVVGLG